jgi:hypothetical protein
MPESELGIDNIDSLLCNPQECDCGQTYGAFGFLQQGIREHGEEAIRSFFALEKTTVLRVNPSQEAVCPSCASRMSLHPWGYIVQCAVLRMLLSSLLLIARLERAVRDRLQPSLTCALPRIAIAVHAPSFGSAATRSRCRLRRDPFGVNHDDQACRGFARGQAAG